MVNVSAGKRSVADEETRAGRVRCAGVYGGKGENVLRPPSTPAIWQKLSSWCCVSETVLPPHKLQRRKNKT